MGTVNSWIAAEKEDAGFWHVGREVWSASRQTYSNRSKTSSYKVCDTSGEDPTCSDRLSPDEYDDGDHIDGYMGLHASTLLDSKLACPKEIIPATV